MTGMVWFFLLLQVYKGNPPTPEVLAEKFLKRRVFIPDHTNTSLLFMFFAQHFTHQFFKTEYEKSPGLTRGRNGIDVSHIILYGQGVERENILWTFKDGKLISHKLVHITEIYYRDIVLSCSSCTETMKILCGQLNIQRTNNY